MLQQAVITHLPYWSFINEVPPFPSPIVALYAINAGVTKSFEPFSVDDPLAPYFLNAKDG